jgi:hypothetical protein
MSRLSRQHAKIRRRAQRDEPELLPVQGRCFVCRRGSKPESACRSSICRCFVCQATIHKTRRPGRCVFFLKALRKPLVPTFSAVGLQACEKCTTRAISYHRSLPPISTHFLRRLVCSARWALQACAGPLGSTCKGRNDRPSSNGNPFSVCVCLVRVADPITDRCACDMQISSAWLCCFR